MKISFGRSCFDTMPEQFDAAWDDLVGLCEDASGVPRHPATKDSWSPGTPWISPALFTGTRCNDHVSGFAAWLGIDIDSPGWTAEKISDLLNGFDSCCYTTTNSRADHQRWRIILRLSREAAPAEYQTLWLFLHSLLSNCADFRTRDLSRILYLPAQWLGADNILFVLHGSPLDVDFILENFIPPPPPDPPPMPDPTPTSDAPAIAKIITPRMIEVAQSKPVGGRLYSMLVAAAIRFRKQGWTLTAVDLEAAGREANRMLSPGKRRPHLLHECENALSWAASNVTAMTPLEKIRERIFWERSRKRSY